MSSLSQFFGGGPQVWVSGTTYTIGTVLLSPADNYQQYVRITNGAGATDPSSDTTNYRPFGARAIKSVQRGVITIADATASATAAITSVVVGKSELRLLGSTYGNSNADGNVTLGRIYLTNATTITATRAAPGVVGALALSWELTEYY